MVEALTTGTRLLVVREVHEDESGAALRFQQGGQGRLPLGEANYPAHLRLARRSQERQYPVGVAFGEGQTITELIRADNDVPSQLWEEVPGQTRVLFQGHDGVFRLRPEHPKSARLRAQLGEALRQKARGWFIAQKPDLALLDVLPAARAAAASPTSNGGGSTAAFRFVGGPLDGLSFDHAQVNAVARVIPVFTESGNRQFLLMPPRDECGRVLRGELTKDQVQGPLHPYERVFTASGAVEYRDAGDGGFESALQERDQPLSEEARARKRTCGELADRFIERLRSTKLTGGNGGHRSFPLCRRARECFSIDSDLDHSPDHGSVSWGTKPRRGCSRPRCTWTR
jgi:hypothetical protein